MLTARQARNNCNDKILSLLSVNNITYLPEVNDIVKRIEEALDKEGDEVIYSINISSKELYYVEKSNILQNLGYVLTISETFPWGAKISW